jgi:hypothetical protein
MIAGCPGGQTDHGVDSHVQFLFPLPRRCELTDSSEPDEGFPHSYQALWMNAA